MTPTRTTIILLASAIPTLLVIALALWILLDALHDRDLQGTWHVVIRDPHGTLIGEGDDTIILQDWKTRLDRHPPFIHIHPDMWDDYGQLTLTPAGVHSLATVGVAIGSRTLSMYYDDSYGDDHVSLSAGNTISRSLTLTVPADGRPGPVAVTGAMTDPGYTVTGTFTR